MFRCPRDDNFLLIAWKWFLNHFKDYFQAITRILRGQTARDSPKILYEGIDTGFAL
jgi:hypothetical protein